MSFLVNGRVFTGVEHGALHTSALHMAKCLIREVADVRTSSVDGSSLNFLPSIDH